MRVGIDCRELFQDNQWAGMAQRLYQLVTRCPLLEPDLEYRLFFSFVKSRHLPKVSPLLRANSRLKIARFPVPVTDFLLRRLPVPIELFVGSVDIFHGPIYFLPAAVSCTRIMTIHDLMFYRHPEFLPRDFTQFFDSIVRQSIKRVDHVVAVSHYTKNDIVDLLGVSEDRIHVIENGVSEHFTPVRDEERLTRVLKKYGLDRPYILFVGTMETKKNLVGLLNAYEELKKNESIDEILVVAGSMKWAYREFSRLVKEKDLEKDVLCTGYIDQEELPALYSACRLFVFPTLFEGGGIPPLEAMACGAPVVTSSVTAVPEMVGDAAVLVNPRNFHDIARGIFEVLTNDDLRNYLVMKGFDRAKQMSWNRTARKVIELYRMLCA
jgi:glycosyltransferase involved in cell wall biosynthesis